MLSKSFTDDLAWKVQRDLVNTYFKFKDAIQEMQPTETGLVLPQSQFMEVINSLSSCADVFQSMMEYSTINYRQQQELLQTARNRVNHLLGGAHSPEYKEWSHTYFINLWNEIKERFQCGSRWQDLNPKYFNEAFDYISEWEYVE